MGLRLASLAWCLAGLSACTTYTMQVGNLNVPAYDQPRSVSAQASQPWYSAIKAGYGYLTVQSSIDYSQAAGSLYAELGCKPSPVSLSSRQQSFSLLASHDFGYVDAAQVGVKQIPLFTLIRDDTKHTCELTGTAVAFGPPALATDEWQATAAVNSSTADTTQAANLADLISGLVAVVPVNPATPVIGATAQVLVKTALTKFDTYASANLQNNLITTTQLLDFQLTDVRQGHLAWSADLSVVKNNSLTGSSNVPVGTLVLTVRTRLSLFTLEQLAVTDISDPTLRQKVIAAKWGLPYIPNFAHLPTPIWDGPVQPLNGTGTVQLSQAVDQLPGLPASDALLPALKGLGDSATSAQVRSFCGSLKERLGQLNFGNPDVLAIVASALAQSDAWNDAKPVMHASNNGCFTTDEQNLLNAMGIEPGNDFVVAPTAM